MFFFPAGRRWCVTRCHLQCSFISITHSSLIPPIILVISLLSYYRTPPPAALPYTKTHIRRAQSPHDHDPSQRPARFHNVLQACGDSRRAVMGVRVIVCCLCCHPAAVCMFYLVSVWTGAASGAFDDTTSLLSLREKLPPIVIWSISVVFF